jgi:hypothetical protein
MAGTADTVWGLIGAVIAIVTVVVVLGLMFYSKTGKSALNMEWTWETCQVLRCLLECKFDSGCLILIHAGPNPQSEWTTKNFTLHRIELEEVQISSNC